MIGLAEILFTSWLSYGAHQSINWKFDAGVRVAMVCVLLVSFAKLTYEQFATHSLIEAAISECKQMLVQDENVCKPQ